jgi:hypothetical protein
MHILYLCEEYPPRVIGGIGQVVRLLAEGMVSRGHRATVVGQYWFDRRGEREQNGGTIIKLPRPRKNRLIRNEVVRRWLLARDFRRLVRERGVDIVDSPSYMGDGAFLKCRRGRCVRVFGALFPSSFAWGHDPSRAASRWRSPQADR